MANHIIYTPCSDKRYERCSNYIINDFDNPKCTNCCRNHEHKNAQTPPKNVEDNFIEGKPQPVDPFKNLGN